MTGLVSPRDGARSGSDTVELEEIMATYEGRLLGYTMRLLKDAAAAQDVVQDVFIKLCRHWERRPRLPAQLKGWLYRVAHNQAVDYVRKESRLKVLHEAHAEVRPSAAGPRQQRIVEEQEAMALALAYLETLSEAEQQVVLLRMQEGLSYREISAVTRRSEGNVGCILHHAMKKIARHLKEAGAI